MGPRRRRLYRVTAYNTGFYTGIFAAIHCDPPSFSSQQRPEHTHHAVEWSIFREPPPATHSNVWPDAQGMCGVRVPQRASKHTRDTARAHRSCYRRDGPWLAHKPSPRRGGTAHRCLKTRARHRGEASMDRLRRHLGEDRIIDREIDVLGLAALRLVVVGVVPARAMVRGA